MVKEINIRTHMNDYLASVFWFHSSLPKKKHQSWKSHHLLVCILLWVLTQKLQQYTSRFIQLDIFKYAMHAPS